MKLADAPDVLTVEQAAEILAVHPQTLRAAIRAGEFEAALRVGRCIRVPRRALEELLSGHGAADEAPDANGALGSRGNLRRAA